MIEVRVSGAVVRMGRHRLEGPATIAEALRAAGGLARRPDRWAAGPFAVRRPLGDRKVDAWKFHLDEPASWEAFELRSGDLIVVQWHITDL